MRNAKGKTREARTKRRKSQFKIAVSGKKKGWAMHAPSHKKRVVKNRMRQKR